MWVYDRCGENGVGLDCVTRWVSEKQIGQRIEPRCGRKGHGSAELAGERIRSIGLTPLDGRHPLELNRAARLDGVRAPNHSKVIDDLCSARHPIEHRVIRGIADLGISARSHRRRRPGKRIGRDPLDAQLLDPIARERVNRTTLAPKSRKANIQFIDHCRREGVSVSEGKLQVVLGLFLIESGECRRERLSDAAIEWRVPGESAPDRVSSSRPGSRFVPP